jgi:hypothetical protein
LLRDGNDLHRASDRVLDLTSSTIWLEMGTTYIAQAFHNTSDRVLDLTSSVIWLEMGTTYIAQASHETLALFLDDLLDMDLKSKGNFPGCICLLVAR